MEELQDYELANSRWLQLIKDLEEAGVKVIHKVIGGDFAYIICIPNTHNLYIFASQEYKFTFGWDLVMYGGFTAGKYFQSLPDEYLKIFVFYFDLFDERNRLQ